MWRLGQVVTVTVRGIKIEQVLKSGTKTVLEQDPCDVSVIAGVEEVAVTFHDYFDRMMGSTSKSPSTVHLLGGLKQVDL